MILSTARLTLRLLTADDWPLFFALHNNSVVIKKCFNKPSEAQIRAKFNERLKPWRPASNHPLCLVISEKSSGKQVGVTGFTASQLPDIQEVGYLLLPEFYGRGYATESLQAFLTWARGEFNIQMVKAVVSAGNRGSEKVLEKCGFKLVRVEPLAYEIAGVLLDDHHFLLDCTDNS
ncbi:GNAT family N-acetyltransferase [Pseudoalteromonas sp. KG3]|uniref:GNAT family N-acetyltransferase n=1 Tax=Pseudoalteromonas TaxID=53246 RepID=UPI0024BC1B8E|nr:MULTISPECIES: GNAT family N-acetyltransferase [Pseudoalteromonas]WKD24564.1 GNAT family N-acetyltransferase [Pseudoalteromonas sp. KG3]